MNYRHAQLLAAEDVGASGTKVIDVDVSKPISQIDIKFRTTKASEGMSAPGPANISKIELVSGSTPFHSLSGYENQALAYYNRPGRVMEHGQHTSTLSEVDQYVIDFGRWLWDEVLAFDPLKFTNPQLRITYNEALSDTSVTANELEVWAHIFDEKSISPLGFLSAIEHHNYTCGADNSYETIELPDDREIRQMLVRAYTDAYEPWYTIDEARFDEGTLDRIPWEYTNLEEYYRRMKSQVPPIRTNCQVNLTTSARNFYFPQTDYWANVLLTGLAVDVAPYVNAVSMRGGKAALKSGSAGQMVGAASGYLPWHCYQFPMGLQNTIEDWYNPKGKKPRLRLRASSSGTNGTGQVVIEELYRY